MRLQSDPTVIYGLAGGQGTLGRPITRADLEARNPYNTYQIDGLPPTPICNPGRSAIEATLNPAKTADLYFVADGTGGHTFSPTLKEHNSAVQVLRRLEREARAKQEQQAAATPGGQQAATSANEAEAPQRAEAEVPLPVRKPKR